MVLPKELEDAYHQEIMEFEEEKKMQYITRAERIGIEKCKKETAKNLLAMGLLTSEQIAQATGLTPEEIRKLKKNVRHGNA